MSELLFALYRVRREDSWFGLCGAAVIYAAFTFYLLWRRFRTGDGGAQLARFSMTAWQVLGELLIWSVAFVLVWFAGGQDQPTWLKLFVSVCIVAARVVRLAFRIPAPDTSYFTEPR